MAITKKPESRGTSETTGTSTELPSCDVQNGSLPTKPANREQLMEANFVPPSTIELRFADGVFLLGVASLEMPIDRIRWNTVLASSSGEAMTVEGIRGDLIPIDSSTLRYLVDEEYAAAVDAELKSLQVSRKELQEFSRDNPPPPELFADPGQDLTRRLWK